jgi:hypothetical protein
VLIKSEKYLETKRLDEVETKIADPYKTLLECVVLWLVQYSCRNSFHTYARVFCEIVRRWRWGTNSAIIYQHILPHCCHRGGQASRPFPRLQCWHDCNAGLPERPSLTDEACALAE